MAPLTLVGQCRWAARASFTPEHSYSPALYPERSPIVATPVSSFTERLPRQPSVTLSANTSWYLLNFRASSIRALLDEGYTVHCLAPQDDYSERLEALGCHWSDLPMRNQGRSPMQDLRLLLTLWRHYRDIRPLAAFHFTVKNNVYGTWAARMNGIAAVNNVSGLGTAFIQGGTTGWLVRALYRLSQPLAHRVFCQNPDDAALLERERLAPAHRLGLLPGSGVDLERFSPAVAKDDLSESIGGPAPGPLRLLYVGRMLGDKGVRELVEAVGQVNTGGVRCELTLCGMAGADNASAIDEATLRAWSTRDGIRWVGPTDKPEVAYAQADVVVLPSYREGLPRTLLEAGAMGLPAIATDVPGCRHVVEHGFNGWLCAARDAQSLADAIEAALATPFDERLAMGQRARRRVAERFDERLVVRAMLEVLEELRKPSAFPRS